MNLLKKEATLEVASFFNANTLSGNYKTTSVCD